MQLSRYGRSEREPIASNKRSGEVVGWKLHTSLSNRSALSYSLLPSEAPLRRVLIQRVGDSRFDYVEREDRLPNRVT